MRLQGALLLLAGLGPAACAPSATGGGRTEEAVATRASRAPQDSSEAAQAPLGDARAVYGTIDPRTGERSEEPAIGRRLREPRRTEVQAGRIRQAAEAYQPEGGGLLYGFRVQVAAEPDYAAATLQAARVNELLKRRLPVYVELVDPWYKVRVGDFATQEAATPTLEELRGLGYADAWTVPTTIKGEP